MPEIIEVEITKQKLTPALRGRRILNFTSDWKRGLKSEFSGIQKTTNDIKGRKVQGLNRRGKVILINLSGNRQLAIHQRMSGHLAFFGRADFARIEKHMHFIFDLSGNKKLVLIDPRKFGTVWYGTSRFIENIPFMRNLGPDALTISQAELILALQNNKSTLKALLLRQDKIAGLGNIMVDETLWHARLSPSRASRTLNEKELSHLYDALKKILSASLARGGTSMRDWRHPDGKLGKNQNYFKIYKQKICPRCRVPIERCLVAGRGTYMCTFCQF